MASLWSLALAIAWSIDKNDETRRNEHGSATDHDDIERIVVENMLDERLKTDGGDDLGNDNQEVEDAHVDAGSI